MKKTWETPTLTNHGPVEKMTQVSIKDVVKVGKFLLPGKGLGLFASFKAL